MKKIMMFFFVLICMVGSVMAQNHNSEPEKQWKPQNDDVYLQEVSVKITTGKPVVSVAEAGGVCFGLVGEQLFRIENETLKPESAAPAGISVLKSETNEIWAIATENDKFVTTKPADGYYGSDITMTMEDGTQILSDPVELGPIAQIESYSGTLYVLRPGQLVLFDGKTVNQDFIDWGRLPLPNTSDLLSFGNRLYIATDRGLGELRGASLKIIKGADGQVNDIATGKNVVYIATNTGIGIFIFGTC